MCVCVCVCVCMHVCVRACVCVSLCGLYVVTVGFILQTFVIENLKPHTQCNVSIAAVNDIGSGPISYTITSTKEAGKTFLRMAIVSNFDTTSISQG